jgi:hypothetical protein
MILISKNFVKTSQTGCISLVPDFISNDSSVSRDVDTGEGGSSNPPPQRWSKRIECIGKFYHSGDMSGSVSVYVIQVLPCSLISIVSRNRSRAAKPR